MSWHRLSSNHFYSPLMWYFQFLVLHFLSLRLPLSRIPPPTAPDSLFSSFSFSEPRQLDTMSGLLWAEFSCITLPSSEVIFDVTMLIQQPKPTLVGLCGTPDVTIALGCGNYSNYASREILSRDAEFIDQDIARLAAWHSGRTLLKIPDELLTPTVPSSTLHNAHIHRTHTPTNSPPLPGLAHWTDIKVSSPGFRVDWTPARKGRTNKRQTTCIYHVR